MEDPQGLLTGLREVGLSRYEAAVYLGLVTDRRARVTEISRRTGVPQPKVYQALDSLVEKGYCTLGSDSVNRYQPVAPEVAMAAHIARLQKEQEETRRLSRSLDALLKEGEGQELWAPPVEIVKGVRQISQMMVQRIQSAREEILFFGKSPIVKAREIAQSLADAGTSGIRLRLLYEASYLEQKDAPEEVALYRSMKGEKRVAPTLPTKLVILDKNIALVSIASSGGSGLLMLVLRHAGLMTHFVSSFEEYWKAGRPLD